MTNGTPGQPDDPYRRPSDNQPVDPTLPQWGQPTRPAGGEPTVPQWGQPTPGGEAPTAPLWGQPPAGPAQPPTSGAGYPPPGPFPPAGPTPAPGAGTPWSAPGGYGTPPPVAPGGNRRGGRIALIIGLVVVLLLCPCLGLAGWAVWQVADDSDEPSVSAPATAAPVDPTEAPTPAPTTAEPSPTEDDEVEFARGDCVVNDGTEDDAELRKVPCGPDTLRGAAADPGHHRRRPVRHPGTGGDRELRARQPGRPARLRALPQGALIAAADYQN